ncbi:MAG: hypothetical protein ABSG89_07735 [Bacteroidales bacterium]|jgi:uncharacterized membrane-anchored protein YhcB (DUF1043 family)
MKKEVTILMISLLIAGVSGLTACRQKPAVKQQKKIEIQTVDTIKKNIESNVYPLPTSAEVIKMLTDLEVGYIFGISNPKENARKYFSSSARAINMGVYGADLSYATLYNIQQGVIDYMDAIKSLADELNMSQIYDKSLYDRIKQNFDNRDELVKILTDAFNNTYKYLADNNQQTLALLVVGGAWVEGMYLTTHVSEAAYQVAGISKNLLEQKKSFDLFMEISKPYLNDHSVADFVNTLEPVRKVYEVLGTSLSEQNIKDITKAMEQVRTQIVQ